MHFEKRQAIDLGLIVYVLTLNSPPADITIRMGKLALRNSSRYNSLENHRTYGSALRRRRQQQQPFILGIVALRGL